jgi:hypothetical protein
VKIRASSASEWVLKPLNIGLGALYGPIILHTIHSSVQRTVANEFKGIVNLNPNVIDGLKATNDRVIIKDEWEIMQEVTIVVFMKMSFVVQLLRLFGLRIFTTNNCQDKKKASGPDSNTGNLKCKKEAPSLCSGTGCETKCRPLAEKFGNCILLFSWYVIILT